MNKVNEQLADMGVRPASKPIAADGTPINSKRYRLREGKVPGESKAARRIRRKATV